MRPALVILKRQSRVGKLLNEINKPMGIVLGAVPEGLRPQFVRVVPMLKRGAN
jgi:hypothetical protein